MKTDIQFVQTAAPAPAPSSWFAQKLRHPFFAWAGLRPPIAQHTLDEHEALERYASGARTVVEIGVAEGASAAGLRAAMPSDGSLYLVDPFHLSRIPVLNFLKRAAHRAVNADGSAQTHWIELFSHDAVRDWKLAIDFLLIDGDHREQAVERDWLDWSAFVAQQGVVGFHDARLFSRGWPTSDYGPVRFVDRYFRQNAVPGGWRIIEEVDSLVFVSRRDRF